MDPHSTGRSGDDVAQSKRTGGKRRPPSSTEQARRVAFGNKWGALNAAHAKTLREKGTT